MSEILLADIGGTTSRFGFAGANGRPDGIMTVANDSMDGPAAAIEECLARHAIAPRAAVFAVAGPVDGDEIALTNRAWRFSLRDLSRRFGFSEVRAINDFEAVAWALPSLAAGDIRSLGGSFVAARGAKVALGPGTGLGLSALVPHGKGWCALASEGGHVSFGPVTADEEKLWAHLRRHCGAVSAETVLSGSGLSRLHAALHQELPRCDSETIVAAAQGGDPGACRTVITFVRMLGRFAGDAALTFKATGGVYLCGGVALGLGALLDGRIFRQAFEAHPPHQRLLEQIPVALVTMPEPGLLGCAALARQMLRESVTA